MPLHPQQFSRLFFGVGLWTVQLDNLHNGIGFGVNLLGADRPQDAAQRFWQIVEFDCESHWVSLR